MNWYDQFFSDAESGSAQDIFARLDEVFQAEVGAIIFSCSTFNPVTRQARRIYTNQPEAYPLSGLKDIAPGHWTETVLDNGNVFVANTIEEIAQVFPDHEQIAGLGCGSVVNIPVKLASKILGTVNLLHEAGYFTGERVRRALNITPAAMITFASLSIGNGGTMPARL